MSDVQPRSTRGFGKRSNSRPRSRHSYQNGRSSNNYGPRYPGNSRPSNFDSSNSRPSNSDPSNSLPPYSDSSNFRSSDPGPSGSAPVQPQRNENIRPVWLDAYVANLKKEVVSEVTKSVMAEMKKMWKNELNDVGKWRSMFHSVKNKLAHLEQENWARKCGISEARPPREFPVVDLPENRTENALEKENVSENGLVEPVQKEIADPEVQGENLAAKDVSVLPETTEEVAENGVEPVQEEITADPEVQGEDLAKEKVSVPRETTEQVCRLLVALTPKNFDNTLSELLELKAEELENAITGFFAAAKEAPNNHKQYAVMWKALHDKKPWGMQQEQALDTQLRTAQSESPSSEFLSTVMFMGELFNQDLVVKSSLVKLLQCLGDGKTECLCHLLKSVGKKCQEVDLDLEEYFKPFEKLLAANSEAPTIENMIKDLIKLKTNGWQADDDREIPEIEEKVIPNGKNSVLTASNKE